MGPKDVRPPIHQHTPPWWKCLLWGFDHSLYRESHFLLLFAQQAQGNPNTRMEITFVVAIVAFVWCLPVQVNDKLIS